MQTVLCWEENQKEFAIISSRVLPHTWRSFGQKFSSQLLKPKIIIINACSGSSQDFGVEVGKFQRISYLFAASNWICNIVADRPKNLTRDDFDRVILEFSIDKTHGDIMVLIVMSHGDEGGARGQIITSDDKDVDIERDIIR